jgi:hypothetical protein
MKFQNSSMQFNSAGDKVAIGLSSLCVIHCLLLPVLILLVPSVSSFWFTDESFHQWMLVGVTCSSILALFIGYKKHGQKNIFAWGALGLSFLVFAFFFGHDVAGELGEKTLTVLGAFIISIGHFKNLRHCKTHSCPC